MSGVDAFNTLYSKAIDRECINCRRFDRIIGPVSTREGRGNLFWPIIRIIFFHDQWVNQLIGVLTAIGLIIMAVSGFVLWRRRKPDDALGAPPVAAVPPKMRGVVMIIGVMALLLPLLAASLCALWLFDRLLLPRLPALAMWLGLRPAQPA